MFATLHQPGCSKQQAQNFQMQHSSLLRLLPLGGRARGLMIRRPIFGVLPLPQKSEHFCLCCSKGSIRSAIQSRKGGPRAICSEHKKRHSRWPSIVAVPEPGSRERAHDRKQLPRQPHSAKLQSEMLVRRSTRYKPGGLAGYRAPAQGLLHRLWRGYHPHCYWALG